MESAHAQSLPRPLQRGGSFRSLQCTLEVRRLRRGQTQCHRIAAATNRADIPLQNADANTSTWRLSQKVADNSERRGSPTVRRLPAPADLPQQKTELFQTTCLETGVVARRLQAPRAAKHSWPRL